MPTGSLSRFVALRCTLLLLLLLASCPTPVAAAAPDEGDPTGNVVVLFRESASAEQRAAALGGQVGTARVTTSAVAPGLALVHAPAGGAGALAERLRADPAVRAAAPDRRVRAAAVPGEYNPDLQPALARIAARDAWAAGFTGAGVTVAVVDTGLDAAHPEFAGRIVTPAAFVTDPSPSALCGPTRPDVTDDNGHGTHVAGIAAAGGDNGGVVGLAWAARLMPIKALDACGVGTYYDLVQGLAYAVGAGARIVNFSLGGYLDPGRPDDAALIALIEAAVDNAYQRGVLVVAAAGNNSLDLGRTPYYPAAARRVVAVAATTLADERAGFSNVGAAVAVAAPGVGVYSTLPTYPSYLNAAGAGYGTLSGTSMASPHVAALAALLLQRDPALGPDDLAAMLAGTSVELGATGRDPLFGVGRIDADAALTRLAPTPRRYFAEGYTGGDFTTYLTLQNTNARPVLALLRLQFDGGGGPTRRYVALPTASRVTLSLGEIVGVERTFSVVVAADGGGVYAERPAYFGYHLAADGRDVDGGHLGGGAPAPATTWRFAEGYTGAGFDQYLTIQNPGADPAQVRITYVQATGDVTTRGLTVVAGGRATVAVHDSALGVGRGRTIATTVESTNGVGIVVERPIYFAYGAGVTGGHTAAGATAASRTWHFAEGYTGAGFDQYLTLFNPNPVAATAQLTYALDGGGTVLRSVPLPASGRTTVTVHQPASPANPGGLGRGYANALRVESDAPIVAERPMYFVYRDAAGRRIDGGHVALGAPTTRTSWSFAEGYTGEGFDEYLAIFNASPVVANVRVTYYLNGGPPRVKSLMVGPSSRATIAVHDTRLGVGRGLEVSATVESLNLAGIVVERIVYFAYAGHLTGGHAALGQ